MTLNERIKKLRKSLDLTQQEFADKLCIKRNTVATYETGKSNPSDAAVVLICKTFNVNETWLRTGEGEMFVELPRNEALAAQIQSFLQGGADSFRERLVSLLVRLTPEQWDALEGYLVELMGPILATSAQEDDKVELLAQQAAQITRDQGLSERGPDTKQEGGKGAGAG